MALHTATASPCSGDFHSTIWALGRPPAGRLAVCLKRRQDESQSLPSKAPCHSGWRYSSEVVSHGSEPAAKHGSQAMAYRSGYLDRLEHNMGDDWRRYSCIRYKIIANEDQQILVLQLHRYQAKRVRLPKNTTLQPCIKQSFSLGYSLWLAQKQYLP